jgi:hypothetical protein
MGPGPFRLHPGPPPHRSPGYSRTQAPALRALAHCWSIDLFGENNDTAPPARMAMGPSTRRSLQHSSIAPADHLTMCRDENERPSALPRASGHGALVTFDPDNGTRRQSNQSSQLIERKDITHGRQLQIRGTSRWLMKRPG